MEQDWRVPRVRECVCTGVQGLLSPRTPSPFLARPTSSLPRTHGSLSSKGLARREGGAEEACAGLGHCCQTTPPAQPAEPAPHSLNELQPLLDVRLPSLPLHQSLGERAVCQLVSMGRWLVTVPTPLFALSHSHTHPISQVPLRVVGHLTAYKDLLNPATRFPSSTPTPRWTLVLCGDFDGPGAAWRPPAFSHTWLGQQFCTRHPKFKKTTLFYQQTQSKEKRDTKCKMMQ